MSCIRLSRRPWPFGLRCVLPVALALAGLGGSSARAAEPAPVVHTHPIELAAGDFVRAVVEQRHDVLVELIGPDGREVVHVDGLYGIREDEELAAVAEQAGLHQLRVRSCPPGVPPDDCFTLRLDPVRPATEADRHRAEAVKLTQQAAETMARGKDLEKQLVARERALPLWSRLGERRRVAAELLELGVVERLLRRTDSAVCRLHAAADLYAELGDTANEAKALNEAGITCEELDPEDAARDLRQAREKAIEAGDRQLQASALNNLGRLQNRRGQYQEARELLTEALALSREAGAVDKVTQTSILVNLASLYTKLFETDRAADLYKEALALGVEEEQAAILNNFGGLQEDLGNWEEALQLYTRALEIVRAQKDGWRAASTLNNIAIVHMNLGQLDQALPVYREAVDQAREAGNLETRIHALSNLGFLYRKMGRIEEALESWRQVGPLAEGRPDLLHVALASRAAIAEEEGRLEAARETLTQAIDWSRKRGLKQMAADMTLAITRVERRQGHLEAALAHIRSAVETIESVRIGLSSPDVRALFLGSRQRYYEAWIETLMQLHRRDPLAGYNAQALEVAEQARARSLIDLLGEAGADIKKGVDPRLLEKERQLRAAVRERDRESMMLIHNEASPESVDLASERLQQAIAEYEELEGELRTSSESYAALTHPRPLSSRQIQQQILGDRTLLLEFALGEERSYLWAATRSTAQSFVLPGRKEIEDAARAFYDAITWAPSGTGAKAAQARIDSAGRALSAMILQDVEQLLGDSTLLVVSDGMLQYVPFAALPLPSSPGKRLVDSNQVVNLPSASTLAALRREIEARKPARRMLAVLADPVFPGDPRLLRIPAFKNDQRARSVPRSLSPRGADEPADELLLLPLPFAAEEAKNILSFVPDPGQRLAALGFEATYGLATSGQLAEYRFVHFATHGLINSQQPKLSKLALSHFDKEGRPHEEAFLRLADIYNLELSADLVVLSACQTALGKDVRGEGLIGLTRGFMYAGAARVLASLWSVEDKATADLMKSFYHHLLIEKRPAPDALRRAQIEMARKPKYQSPYYWAGFSLQGEWK